MMLQKSYVYAVFIFVFVAISDGGTGQTGDALREQINRGTVKLVTGGSEYVSNIYMHMAGEIAALLDKQSAPHTIHVLLQLTRAQKQAPGTLAFAISRRPA